MTPADVEDVVGEAEEDHGLEGKHSREYLAKLGAVEEVAGLGD